VAFGRRASRLTRETCVSGSLLYARLKERGIPYLIYSGYPKVEGAGAGALHIAKPAASGVLVSAMEKLIRDAVPS
jgi:hypothetical protein